MQKEAEEHASEDEKRKQEIETINNADSLVYQTENLLKDFEGKVSSSEIEKIKAKIEEMKALLKPEKKDAGAIKAKLAELQALVQEASTELYQKAQQARDQKQEPEQKPEGTNPDKDNAVDADFKVEDDKK